MYVCIALLLPVGCPPSTACSLYQAQRLPRVFGKVQCIRLSQWNDVRQYITTHTYDN